MNDREIEEIKLIIMFLRETNPAATGVLDAKAIAGEFDRLISTIEGLQQENKELKDHEAGFEYASADYRLEIKVLKEEVQTIRTALEKCLELGECQLDYGGSIDALEQVAETASKALGNTL